MNRRIAAALSVLVVLLLFLFFYNFYFQNRQSSGIKKFVYQESRITQVRSDSIVVEGTINSSDSNDKRSEKKIIEFRITSETILRNRRNVITSEQILSKKQFSPKTEILEGALADFISSLNHRVSINFIQTKGDLFAVNKTTAEEIDYSTYEFPSIPNL